jgi:hypothetical protein
MEIKISTEQVLKVMQIISWIIFIGLCVEAGGILFNIGYTFFVNPENAAGFWRNADLSDLYRYDKGQFLVITTIMFIVAVLKAVLFYLIVRLFIRKKLNLHEPFNKDLQGFILRFSFLTLGIGLFCHAGFKYSKWLVSQQVSMPDPYTLQFAGADVWLFMTVTLFVIAQIVKRGIELQNEHDLTI